jgi:hypothetical protein
MLRKGSDSYAVSILIVVVFVMHLQGCNMIFDSFATQLKCLHSPEKKFNNYFFKLLVIFFPKDYFNSDFGSVHTLTRL